MARNGKTWGIPVLVAALASPVVGLGAGRARVEGGASMPADNRVPAEAAEDRIVIRATSADGTSIAAWRSGTGPPLVLVHGAMADHRRWSGILPDLEARFTVYAIDRRGRGGSGDAEVYAIDREIEDLVAVVDAIGAPVTLLGHSFGAYCALEAALLTPDVQRLILYEAAPPGIAGTLPPDVEALMEQQLAAGDHEDVVATFLVQVAGIQPRELELMRSMPAWPGRVATAPTILREIRALERRPQLARGRYRSIDVPTLLLVGGDSHPLYRETIEEIDAALPKSRLVVMAGQQHVAMDTAPELFLGELFSFVETTTPPAAR